VNKEDNVCALALGNFLLLLSMVFRSETTAKRNDDDDNDTLRLKLKLKPNQRPFGSASNRLIKLYFRLTCYHNGKKVAPNGVDQSGAQRTEPNWSASGWPSAIWPIKIDN